MAIRNTENNKNMFFFPARKQRIFTGLKKFISLILVYAFAANVASAGIAVLRSNGINLTSTNSIEYFGTNGITVSGADSYLAYRSNGISLTGTDGVTVSGADGVTVSGADGVTYTSGNGVTVSGADGVTVSGADGVTVSGADGVTVTGADGTEYSSNSISITTPNGVTVSGADGVTVSGADGVTVSGADGVTVSGADGVTVSGADGVTVSGADGITGSDENGVVFHLAMPTSVTISATDGITITGADGVTVSGADGITVTGTDEDDEDSSNGLQSIDPELALLLNQTTDDSNLNAVLVYHHNPTETDLDTLRQIGILGGTKFNYLPFITVSATKSQLIEVSHLPTIRSIYGKRTLNLNSDPYYGKTGIHRVSSDNDLQTNNSGLPITGRNVTVAVLDTGVNSQHNDLNGKVIQNVKLVDTQSVPVGFIAPTPIENLPNSDLLGGHGTFVSGIIAASGLSSGGKYNGVASGAKILGLSAGDLALTNVLSGFEYILQNKSAYNIRVVNCSFSANTVYDAHDPVNIATKLLTENGVNVVFSAGNSGPGNGTLNPYASAPWVIAVGASDKVGKLAKFSSRSGFGANSPTLVAPGVDIISLRSTATQTSVSGIANGDVNRLTPTELPFYTVASGTSFSAPQVAGAIALMLDANPNLTTAEVKDILSRTATPLPNYYKHEVGAGMLNTYAAVLESAFPNRKMGYFRAVMDKNSVKYITEISNTFSGTTAQNSPVSNSFSMPANTIQAGIHIAWASNSNDLSMKLYDSNNALVSESNYINATGLNGRREKILLNTPSSQIYKTVVQHTGNLGSSQEFFGAVELTRLQISQINDIANLSTADQNVVKESLGKFMMLPFGNRFRPGFAVSRSELAESFVRSGFVPQYVANNSMFPDVKDLTTRNAVESVQNNPQGNLFYDVASGGNFNPYQNANKLVSAVAFVNASNLQDQLVTAVLPITMTDKTSIPTNLRPYVAVAINNGLIKLDGNKFNPNRALTRLELATALVKLRNLTK